MPGLKCWGVVSKRAFLGVSSEVWVPHAVCRRSSGQDIGLAEQAGSPAPASVSSQGGICAFGCRAEATHCLNKETVVLHFPPNSS